MTVHALEIAIRQLSLLLLITLYPYTLSRLLGTLAIRAYMGGIAPQQLDA
jgi:hypothetical protein